MPTVAPLTGRTSPPEVLVDSAALVAAVVFDEEEADDEDFAADLEDDLADEDEDDLVFVVLGVLVAAFLPMLSFRPGWISEGPRRRPPGCPGRAGASHR